MAGSSLGRDKRGPSRRGIAIGPLDFSAAKMAAFPVSDCGRDHLAGAAALVAAGVGRALNGSGRACRGRGGASPPGEPRGGIGPRQARPLPLGSAPHSGWRASVPAQLGGRLSRKAFHRMVPSALTSDRSMTNLAHADSAIHDLADEVKNLANCF